MTNTRTYDTGLPLPITTLLRRGIKAKLAPTLRSNGAFARMVIDFPFVMSNGNQGEIDILTNLLSESQCPSYAVAIGDCKAKRAGAPGHYLGTLDVEVYAVTNHMRHVVSGRLEEDVKALALDTVDPGVEVMIEIARQLLTDAKVNTEPTPGANMKELRLAGWRELSTLRELSLWGLQFTVDVELPASQNRGVTQLLEDLKTYHRIGAYVSPDPATPPLMTTITEV